MASLAGNVPVLRRWRLFPSEGSRLSRLRLVAPVAPGLYGRLAPKLMITSNHGPSLAAVAATPGLGVVALEGGGFPVAVAAAFGRLRAKELPEMLGDELEQYEGRITLLLPRSIARAWGWSADQPQFGCPVQIVPDSGPLNNGTGRSLPAMIVRLLAALWLALGQVLLMALPVLAISAHSLLWAALAMLVLAVLLALAWPVLPCCGMVKGSTLGLVCALIVVGAASWRVSLPGIVLPPLAALGVFIGGVWMGIICMGARSTTN